MRDRTTISVTRETYEKLRTLGRGGKALMRLESDDVIPKVFILSDDLIRECLIQYQQVENDPKLTLSQKLSLRNPILAQINAFLQTQIKATQAMTPKSESISITQVKTDEGEGTKFELKRRSKTVDELIEELKKEGKWGNATTRSG